METIKITWRNREIFLSQQDLIFVLTNITDKGRKDLEDEWFWLLSGEKDL